MKKIAFMIFLIIIAILAVSCPQNVVKGTVWEGTINGAFGGLADDNENDIQAYFKPNNTMKLYIVFENSANEFTVSLEGNYSLSNNHALTTPGKLDGFFFIGDAEMKLTGIVNYYTGQGNGKYELTINGTKYEDDWDLMKVGSY